MKIVLVSSIGGHLTDLLALSSAFDGHERVWVLNDRSPVLPASEPAYIVAHAERDWRVAWNVVEFAAIFARERPDVVVSAGAGPAVPAAVVARAARIPFVYIEPSSAVTSLTLTGRIMRALADRFYVQWEPLRARAPEARFVGGVL